MIKHYSGISGSGMTFDLNVTCNDNSDVVKKSKGRAKIYDSAAARVAACRARKNLKAVTFDLSPDVLNSLNVFMSRRVDSSLPDETKSHVVERALKQFLRKR